MKIVKSCRAAGMLAPPELVVEALNAGGTGRFINDCWAREGGKKSVNVEPRGVWDADTNTPAIMMVATRRIRENEELVSDYGENFWKIVWRDLRVLQTEFWRRCAARVRYVERRLRDAGVPLPKLPEPLTGPIFIGAKPHIDPAKDAGEDADDAGAAGSDSEGGARVGRGGGRSSLAAALTGET